MRIKSAVDNWYKIFIGGTILIILGSVFWIPPEERTFALAVLLVVPGLLLWITLSTYYEFREEYLYCRCGLFFEKIPYEKIKSAKLCRNFLSSMALSSKRIEIRQHGRGYITGTTMISPVNREAFLQELLARCANLQEP